MSTEATPGSPKRARPPLRAHSQEALDWYNQVSAVPGALLGMAYLLFLIVPAATGWDVLGGWAILVANQSFTLAFAADYLLRLWMAPERRLFFRKHLYDLLVIAVPALRPLRAMRSLQFFPATRQGTALMVVASATILVLVGAVYEYAVESPQPDANITNYGDAVWWAVVTVTTVGYGDFYPITVPGRVIAVGLMVVGIAIIGTITATVSSSFMSSMQRRRTHPARRGERTGDTMEEAELEVTMVDLSDALAILQTRVDEVHALMAQIDPGAAGGSPGR